MIQPWEADTLSEATTLLAKRAAVCRRLRTIKTANVLDSIKNVGSQALGSLQDFHSKNPLMASGLAGAGLGAVAGGLSSAMSPREERRQPLSDALTGALAGGAMGLGGQALYNNAPAMKNWFQQLSKTQQLQSDIDKRTGLVPSVLKSLPAQAPGENPVGDVLRKVPVVGKALGGLSDAGKGAYGTLFGETAGQAGSATVPLQAGVMAGQAAGDLYHKVVPQSGTNLRAGAESLLNDKKGLLQGLSKLVRQDAVDYAKPRYTGVPSNIDFAAKAREAFDKAREVEMQKALAAVSAASGRGGTAKAVGQLGTLVGEEAAPGIMKQLGQLGQSARAASPLGRWAGRIPGHLGWAMAPALMGFASDPQAAARRAMELP